MTGDAQEVCTQKNVHGEKEFFSRAGSFSGLYRAWICTCLRYTSRKDALEFGARYLG